MVNFLKELFRHQQKLPSFTKREEEIAKTVPQEVIDKVEVSRNGLQQAAFLYPYYKHVLEDQKLERFSYIGVLAALGLRDESTPFEVFELSHPKVGASGSLRYFCGVASEEEMRAILYG